jgi:DNA-binding XRE family transcriptional regulator
MENSESHLTQGRNSTRADETDARNPTEGGRIFGLLVSDQRAKLGLTQAELAARLQISRSTISRVERGHPPSPELEYRLAAVLNTDAPPGPMARLVSRVARGIEGRTFHVPVGSYSRWGIAVLALVAPLFVMGGLSSRDLSLTEGQSGVDHGSSVPRDSLAALSGPAIPADFRQKTGDSSATAGTPPLPGQTPRGTARSLTPGQGTGAAPPKGGQHSAPSGQSAPTASVPAPQRPAARPDPRPATQSPAPSGGSRGTGGGGSGGTTGGGSSGGSTSVGSSGSSGSTQGVQQTIGTVQQTIGTVQQTVGSTVHKVLPGL